MSSPFAGLWVQCAQQNAELILDKLHLPAQFKTALKNVHVFNEIHVNGEHVHINVMAPKYTVPSHTKELRFAFGVEHTQSLPFGLSGKVTVKKEADHKWHARVVLCDGKEFTITREVRNGEMWVTFEGACCGNKMVRKYERFSETPAGCAAPAQGASPLEGCWRLYGSDNLCGFMQALGLPPHLQCALAAMTVHETISVTGNDVCIKIHLPDMTVPCHSMETAFKFGEPHDVHLPFGNVRAVGYKLSETKWIAKLHGVGSHCEAEMVREMVGCEMWVTLKAQGKHVVFKFTRACGSSC